MNPRMSMVKEIANILLKLFTLIGTTVDISFESSVHSLFDGPIKLINSSASLESRNHLANKPIDMSSSTLMNDRLNKGRHFLKARHEQISRTLRGIEWVLP